MTTTLLNLVAWLERGGKPDDEHAPTIEELQAFERGDLIARVDRFGQPPLWSLTSDGIYERDRLLAARYPEGDPDDAEVTSTSDDRKLGAAFRRLWIEWDEDKDEQGVINGSASDLCSDVFAVFTSNGLEIR